MGKPKKPKVEAPKPIAPAATVSDVQPAVEEEAKKQQRQTGYRKQILTGSLTPTSGKRTTLG